MTSKPDEVVRRAARVIDAGGVVAHACEGVWGFACDPDNRMAVERVLRIKRRAAAQGLIVIGATDADFAPELDRVDDVIADRVRASWPGAVTWIVPNHRFPAWVVGDFDTVAIRVPGHEQARELARACGHPLVSTSANRSSEAPARSQREVARFADEVDYVLPGEIGGREQPSTIVDAASGEVLRGAAPGPEAAE